MLKRLFALSDKGAADLKKGRCCLRVFKSQSVCADGTVPYAFARNL